MPLTLHACPVGPPREPEATIAIVHESLVDCPVKIGDLDIAPHVAALIARPLGNLLYARRTELINALESDV